MTPHNLYFHVPFCASKCHYCAFYSYALSSPASGWSTVSASLATTDGEGGAVSPRKRGECRRIVGDEGGVWNTYETAIISEIKQWAHRAGRVPVPTIFFGGGTPSLMPTDVFTRIMDATRDAFDVTPDTEITLESNPGTLDAPRLAEFITAGVNRLSVGVQSLDDNVLKFFGRRHSAADARRLLDAARAAGIRVSADFIYGLPDQTVADVEKMCRDINALNLNHVSLYELSIEPGTPFAAQKMTLPDNDIAAEMFEIIGNTLNLPRYEVSNYARPGEECQHNVNIWDGDAYIGFGPSACGRPYFDDGWWEQKNDVGAYGIRPLDARTRAIEKIITGLRTARGVALTPDVTAAMNMDFIQLHPELLSCGSRFTDYGSRLVTTQKGLLLLDNILVSLVK